MDKKFFLPLQPILGGYKFEHNTIFACLIIDHEMANAFGVCKSDETVNRDDGKSAFGNTYYNGRMCMEIM
jgi:hypothetical protein